MAKRDQAETLRRMMERAEGSGEDPRSLPGRVISIAGGAHGSGATSVAAWLGAIFCRDGLRALLLDGATGARIETRPGSAEAPDLTVIDAGSGVSGTTLHLHRAEYENLVVVVPEDRSLTDSALMIRALHRRAGVRRVGVIVNRVTDEVEAGAVFGLLAKKVARAGAGLRLLGHLSRGENLTEPVSIPEILLDLERGAPLVAGLERLAARLRAEAVGAAGGASNRFMDELAG